MKIEHDQDGDVILNPDDLAREFNLSSEQFRRYLQQGMVTSRIERGEGEDAGTSRVTVRIGNRVWEAVVDTDSVISQQKKILGSGSTQRPA